MVRSYTWVVFSARFNQGVPSRLRRRAAFEVTRGIHDGSTRQDRESPTIAILQARCESAVRDIQRGLGADAGELIVEHHSLRAERALLLERIAKCTSDTGVDRQEMLATARRLQARINRIDLQLGEVRPEVDRDLRAARLAALRVFDHGDLLVAGYWAAVLEHHPQPARLGIEPPRLRRPSWITATTLDQAIETLFPEAVAS